MVLIFIVIVWVCMRRLKREGPSMDDGRDAGGGGEPRRVRLDDIPPIGSRAEHDARTAGGAADRPVFFGCDGHDVEDFSALLAAGDDTEEASGDELDEQPTRRQPGLVLRDPRDYGCE